VLTELLSADTATFPVVALVGSAGGVEAVTRILAGLPNPFPAAVIVLIHQAPEHPSKLVRILARSCGLSVEQARHDQPLVAGTVIVVPPGRHLLVTPEARTGVIASGEYPPARPSADLLLSTLAISMRQRAVAVILSGGGHDGATGATAVHVFGGTVLATDATSSRFPSMPLAAIRRDEAVDLVLPLDVVPAAVTRLVLSSELPSGDVSSVETRNHIP
jgi:two-component system chemotaxis response regulator CheB